MTETSDFEMQEQGQRRRYVKAMPNCDEAELTVVKTSPTHWIADHTYVPPAYRGGDVALALVERLVEDARSEGVKIHAACSYVAKVFKRRGSDLDDVRA